MKVMLLNPPFKAKSGRYSRASRSPAISKGGTVYYPFWLAYAAGNLEKNGHEVELVDACAYGYGLDETNRMIREFCPDLVVIDTSTPSIYSDVAIGAGIKKILPNCFIALVGTHPSALPEDTLKIDGSIDAVVRGEYDVVLVKLARVLELGETIEHIKSISYCRGEKVVHNPREEMLEDLDGLPFVSSIYKKHLNVRKYFFSAARYPMIMIITGRGCPFRCFFCVYPQTFHGRKYRLRSAENVVDEFSYIVENFPKVKEVGIEDDTFTADVKRVRKICDMLIDRKLNKKIKWWANCRVNLDLDTMRLMKKAGCRLVIPGFESGVQEILDNMKKGIKVEQSIEFAKNAKKAGLLVHGCFMVGNPRETRETMNKTLEFACKLGIDTAQFFPVIPYPGTEAYEWAVNNGLLAEKPFDKWLTEEGLHSTIVRNDALTEKDLVEFCDYARKRFYLRKEYILYKLKQSLTDLQEAKRTFKSFKVFVKHLLK